MTLIQKCIKVSKNERAMVYIFGAVIALISLSHMFFRTIPYIYNDEFGYWATAAYLRGYDWSGVFQNISYYGYGYGIILSVFLFLFQDTGAAYIGAVGLNAVWLVGAYASLLTISKRMAPNRSVVFRAFLAFACTLYSNNVTQSFYTWPENFLFFLFCLMVYLLYTIQERPTRLNCVILGLLSAYSYVVHQRTIGIVGAVGVAMVWFLLRKDIRLRHFLCFAGVIVAGLIVVLAVRGIFISGIWQDGSTADANNMAGQVSKLQLLASVQGVKQLIVSLCGKLFYLICATGLLLLWALERLLWGLMRGISSAVREKSLRQIDGMTVFFLVALAANLLVSAVFMLTPSGTVHVVYGRYNDNIMGPFLLLGFLQFLEQRQNPLRSTAYGGMLLLCALGVRKSQQWFDLGGHAQVNCAGISRFVTPTDIKVWQLAFLVMMCFCILLALKEVKFKGTVLAWLPVAVCAVVWIFVGMDSAMAFQQSFGDWRYAPEDSSACAEVISDYEQQSGETVSTVYAVEEKDGDYPQRYIANGIQFALPEQEVQYITWDDIPEIADEHCVVVTAYREYEIDGLESIYQGSLYEVWVPAT